MIAEDIKILVGERQMTKSGRDIANQRKSVGSLTDTLMRWIQIVGVILVSTFAFLEFKNAPIDKITQAFDVHSVTKLGLFIFFTGWLLGATDDTKIQKIAYDIDPKEGILGIAEYIGIFVFISIFYAMFLIHEQLVWFQLFVLILICVNMWTYSHVIMKRANVMIEASRDLFIDRKDNAAYFKLYAATQYLTGRWQRRRFYWLFCLAVLQIIVALYLKIFTIPENFGQIKFGGVSVDVLFSYTPSFLFLIYVIVSELWMKIYRFKIFSDFVTIDEITEHFKISRIANTDLPVIVTENLFFSAINKNENYQ